MRLWILLIPLAAALIGANAYWGRYYIPSGSMKPTLLVGDYILTKPAGDDLARGDVIVFRHPVRDQDFVFRLIGLPSDRVQMKDGMLYLADVAVQVEDDGTFAEIMEPQGPMGSQPQCANGPVGIGATCEKARRTEILPNGVSYSVLNIGDRQADHTGVFTVPAGEYFVLGDNRDNASDSRFPATNFGVGFVPAQNVHSRVIRVVFSSAGRSLGEVWNWRSDRFWKDVL